ncbi:PLP-dependent aminotransferase family protein [Streptomyces sp. PTM05]|uniref:PLP-dependent aminotransferase family protein n=1 Tax=Streptantibioticus parmotrematis TaxID=2873249 RepID=A0ABS7R0R4_9ACTN|nr:PLP-dependent aminotransferase family protein [Streptantibioticus parmotrematis]MBY8889063.1 PLP-dependent aminotransferase family protein [Streptantibioticus parmotrematis]
MARPGPDAELTSAQLHSSLSDPLLDVMNFLNEVTSRHPEAISFGPGRPYDGFFEVDRIGDYLTAYTRYLETDLGRTPEEVRTALFQYGRTNGQINDLVARTLANDEDIHVDPAHVVVTVGCQEAMLLVLRALVTGPDDVVLVTDPGYVGITGAARLLDAETVPVPEDEAGLDPDALLAAVREVRARGKQPRAVYVIPDFANPSGTSMPVDRRRRLLELAAEEDLLLLEDNPYGFFSRTGEHRPTLKSLDTRHRVVHFGSFAKTCFPGARVGYVIADQPVVTASGARTVLADELSKIKSMVTVNTPALAQAVIGGMLVSYDCRLREADKDLVDFYRGNMEALLAALDRHLPQDRWPVRWNVPDGGFFLSLTVPFDADDAFLRESAGDHGVIWTPMRYFHLGSGGERQIRLSASYLTPHEIDEGVRRLAGHVIERLTQGDR